MAIRKKHTDKPHIVEPIVKGSQSPPVNFHLVRQIELHSKTGTMWPDTHGKRQDS